MKFDIFFSICQSQVGDFIPTETQMLQHFFDQIKLADTLGFETAWIAESHFSVQVQKENPNAVVPNFKGEIGLNCDIFQLAHRIFSCTKNINVGSAIMNLLSGGGPITKAEATKYFIALHALNEAEKRKLFLGFASGRFPYQSAPFGIAPRNAFEKGVWPSLKGKIFLQGVEIFLRLLKGEVISSDDIKSIILGRDAFRSEETWKDALQANVYNEDAKEQGIYIPAFWQFEKLGIVPQDIDFSLLQLVIGSHDPHAQKLANEILPCSVFNLSITSNDVIEQTHENMKNWYHPDGGEWQRDMMPRTSMIFINNDHDADENEKCVRAQQQAKSAMVNYWQAMEGTIDQNKIDSAVSNTLCGSPTAIIQQMRERFHQDDRVMLWFDFSNHNNDDVKKSMHLVAEHVLPELRN
ncbi:LLM class flavin-dependent oxidoreductase [Pseudoalteromonas denitrificans]|uniref:Flavin-dependent oxidoreductase, luciferase family (Includes alkanesulfonate monooxygenase SsuD and methylene tetrahydromethanopterin reductase) n=1 Tax=Pseudoalteromonas denitrificans DSM 6059 TaxID=1123010 RepID=A0A1I1RQJ0_9GAMM|nr:LLM class flavin-dependent oxidoreductase [Pseudoalteromonas denitrificans]SFD36535.1 Flavin-dependent oxidoreductase, luciferase family (includes alkanesulfonate monooxygenase SsuD and methylene tetrahydromethanopterin reductase) [Pseudoalteromonas denitrificans DSM 6059]